MKKIIFIFLITNTIIFASDSILIVKPRTIASYEYINYALADIIKKSIDINSPKSTVEILDSSLTYSNIKKNIKKITEYERSKLSLTYNVVSYKDGIKITFFLYDAQNNKWIERSIFNKEENTYITINEILDNLKNISNKENNKKNKNLYITENDFLSLIGYYQSKVKNELSEKELYDYFLKFYDGNIYFNIDYLEYLLENGNTSENALKATEKLIKKNHHYSLYLKSYDLLNKYKKDVIKKDIELSKKYIDMAIGKKNSDYKYFILKSKIDYINGDYENAIKSLNEALKLDYNNEVAKKEIEYLSKALKK